MTINRLAPAVAAAFVASSFCAAPADALMARAFVSGTGSDVSTCGPRASPCRTFQYAHDAIVSAGGEIAVLDAAGYGPLNVTKSLSVVNDNAGVAATAYVTIDAGASGVVLLRGLLIEVFGPWPNGIEVASAGSVTISNCVIRKFTQNGVYIHPPANAIFYILDSFVERNGLNGVYVNSGANIVIGTVANVRSNANGNSGMVFAGGAGSQVTVTNSVAVGNSLSGVGAIGIPVIVSDTNASSNGAGGFWSVLSGAAVYLTRVIATGNNYGVLLQSSGVGYSYGDNRIDGNAAVDVSGGTLTSLASK